jgi:hypothetical protein
MADLRMTLLDLLNKSEQGADPTFLRDGIKLLAQELMDAEAPRNSARFTVDQGGISVNSGPGRGPGI